MFLSIGWDFGMSYAGPGVGNDSCGCLLVQDILFQLVVLAWQQGIMLLISNSDVKERAITSYFQQSCFPPSELLW